MLKRLTRKLITLSVLVVALAAVSSAPASATSFNWECYQALDPNTGECVIICCDGSWCDGTPCPT
jgi:hypothetical protein